MYSDGYEVTFNRDFNSDGRIGNLIRDDDSDGIVDGSGSTTYQLYDNGNAIDLTTETGESVSNSTSSDWNATKAVKVGSEWNVLLTGLNSRVNQFVVWTTDQTGEKTNGTGWLSSSAMKAAGYETTFNIDFDGDGVIDGVTRDDNADGLVDGSNLSAYKLYDDGNAISLRASTGRTYSDSTTSNWDVVQAVKTNGSNTWNVLLEGEDQGNRDGQFFVWTTNSNGVITEGSRWKSPAEMQSEGYEPIFNRDFDGDGVIGSDTVTLPLQYQATQSLDKH